MTSKSTATPSIRLSLQSLEGTSSDGGRVTGQHVRNSEQTSIHTPGMLNNKPEKPYRSAHQAIPSMRLFESRQSYWLVMGAWTSGLATSGGADNVPSLYLAGGYSLGGTPPPAALSGPSQEKSPEGHCGDASCLPHPPLFPEDRVCTTKSQQDRLRQLMRTWEGHPPTQAPAGNEHPPSLTFRFPAVTGHGCPCTLDAAHL